MPTPKDPEVQRRANLIRHIKKASKQTAQQFAAEVLFGTPALEAKGYITRVMRMTKEILDDEDTDTRIKYEMLRRLMDMHWGRPAEAQAIPVESKSPVMIVPPKIGRDEWQAQYGPARKTDEFEKESA